MENYAYAKIVRMVPRVIIPQPLSPTFEVWITDMVYKLEGVQGWAGRSRPDRVRACCNWFHLLSSLVKE